jgi:asparagine synthase (glutamine-hydrolysing)
VTALPVTWKLRHGRRKYLLKRLAERLGVPREVLHRRKQGFAVPLVHWMRNELKNEVAQLLLEPRALQRGYFDGNTIRKRVEEHFRGQRDHSGVLWLLLAFELWHRNFLETHSGQKGAEGATLALSRGQPQTASDMGVSPEAAS